VFRRIIFAFIAFVLCLPAAHARDGLGLGIILGDTTGVSFKNWIGKTRAVDGAAAWASSDNNYFQLHMDYLIHDFTALQVREARGRLPVYYGIGGRVKFNDNKKRNHDVYFGVRVPIGIAYLTVSAPLEFFIEAVPILDLIPGTDFDINGAIGARYYF